MQWERTLKSNFNEPAVTNIFFNQIPSKNDSTVNKITGIPAMWDSFHNKLDIYFFVVISETSFKSTGNAMNNVANVTLKIFAKKFQFMFQNIRVKFYFYQAICLELSLYSVNEVWL